MPEKKIEVDEAKRKEREKRILEINFDTKMPEKREITRRTGHSYGGDVDNLVDNACAGCLAGCERVFSQSSFCQMGVATLIGFSIKDSVVIMHGPIGCGSQSHSMDFTIRLYGAQRGKQMANARWFSTNLSEAEVVHGGEKKLRETILMADKRFRPSAIFVLMTCAPSVIGDDIDSVLDELRSETTAPLVPLHCPGFKAKVFSSAYDVVYHGIQRAGFQFTPEPYVDFEPIDVNDPLYELKVKNYEYQKNHTVNLYNAVSIGAQDEAEMRRLLEALGLNVRFFVEFSHPDDWRTITEAALNVAMCHVHDLYFLEYLKKAFGMPYLLPTIPVGSSSTRKFVEEIAAFFGLQKEAKALLDKEELKLKEALAPIRERVKGKKVIIGGGYMRVGTAGLLADEIGMEVVGMRNFNYDTYGNELFQEIEDTLGNIPTAISNQSSELVNMVRKLNPDIAISHPGLGIWMNKLGVPSIALFSQRFTFFGYKGAYELARRIDRTLANRSYSRNLSRNIELPYTDEWFEKDYDHYIVDKTGDLIRPLAGFSVGGGCRRQAASV
ncbi:MAG: oxalate:formate antiporter [Clostridiales Family XIII bacterium]|jgi:nitrogenase molybdenum-iron protein alpha chain|nr:oxalate:formate antiporter [Clostridiales Family XIII bacterium]